MPFFEALSGDYIKMDLSMLLLLCLRNIFWSLGNFVYRINIVFILSVSPHHPLPRFRSHWQFPESDHRRRCLNSAGHERQCSDQVTFYCRQSLALPLDFSLLLVLFLLLMHLLFRGMKAATDNWQQLIPFHWSLERWNVANLIIEAARCQFHRNPPTDCGWAEMQGAVVHGRRQNLFLPPIKERFFKDFHKILEFSYWPLLI